MANDPYWNNVVLAMHMDGVDNGTTFVDAKAHTLTLNGNVCTKTGVYKYGTASAYFDGTGDYIAVSPTSDFQIGDIDFCVEAFVRVSSIASPYVLFSANNYTSASGLRVTLYNGQIYVDHNSVSFNTTAAGVTANAWKHVAVTKSGTTYSVFVDGVLVSTETGTPSAVTYDRVTIGALVANGSSLSAFSGYVDDLRITKGFARYTTGPNGIPSEAFPDTPPQISGTVTDASNNPATRSVRSHRRSDGAIGGTTTSAADGTFSVNAYDSSEHYVVCFDNDATENALIFDNITPV